MDEIMFNNLKYVCRNLKKALKHVYNFNANKNCFDCDDFRDYIEYSYCTSLDEYYSSGYHRPRKCKKGG